MSNILLLIYFRVYMYIYFKTRYGIETALVVLCFREFGKDKKYCKNDIQTYIK